MNTFCSLLKTALRQQLQYRSAMLAGMLTQLVFAFIYIMVYIAYYTYAPAAAQGMTLAQAVSYTWINQACLQMMSLSGLNEVQEMMRDGRIAFELARPADLHGMWYARALAVRLAPFALNAPLTILIGLVMPREMRLVFALEYLPVGLLSLGLSVLLSAAMTVLMTATCFWTIDGNGINRLLPMVATVCSGNLLPLAFYPAGVRAVLRALPFAAIADAPMRILVGACTAREAAMTLLTQAVWLAALLVLGRVTTDCGVRRCMVQGG